MKFHPLADCMPMLTESEMIELSDDIKNNGLNNPITLFEGMILDGRNRYVACKKANIEPEYTDFDGDFEQATAFVISANITRRHLTASQKAASAAELATVHGERLREEANARQIENLKIGPVCQKIDTRENEQNHQEPKPFKRNESRTTSKLADMTGANRTYVHEAIKIKEENPELFNQIKSGEKSISQAKKEVNNHRAMGTGENEWYTPEQYIRLAIECMGSIDLDPASSEFANRTVGASKYFDAEQNGLENVWFGNVWLNPPYSQPDIMRFSEKAVAEYLSGNIKAAIILTHNYTDTAWFQLLAEHSKMICFTKGRIRFENANGKKAAPTQGQAFFYFGDDGEIFEKVFSEIGFIARLKNDIRKKS